MKNHVAFKFLAVLLCALTLLSSAVCVLGLVVLEKQDLYEENLPALLEKQRQETLSDMAGSILSRYATVNLGGCSEALADAYYGLHFYYYNLTAPGPDTWAYAILDPEGKEVASSNAPNRDKMQAHSFSDRVASYLKLLEEPTPETEGHATNELWTDENGVIHYVYPSDGTPNFYLNAVLQWELLQGYTVNIYTTDAAFSDSGEWNLVLLLWNMRYNIIYILVGSLLIFAVCAVYLCCAAGKRPGSTELRPGGLNVLPLDLYGFGVAILCLMSVYGVQETVNAHFSLIFAITWVLLIGFVDCLAVVGFCFACAAQFKMDHWYFARHSLTGFLWGLLWKLLRAVVWDFLPWLVQTLWKIGKVLFGWCRDGVLAVWTWVKKGFGWLWGKTVRFYGLLPMTWQWIAAGVLLMIILFIGDFFLGRYGHEGGFLICVALALGLVLFGAYSFGILLEAARKMGDGALDAAVNKHYLIGSFRDFADALTDLAGVARIAAQNEMKSERMKTELITNVSHDIKTPLTSIINYVDLLEKPHTPEQEREYLEVLGRKSQQLKKLIQDLVEMSKASSGNMAADIRRVDAVEAVNQALGEYADKLAACPLITVFPAPEGPVWMLADGRLTWRVLSNLLSNAVKYAMPGTRLYVEVGQNQGSVLISLKNISAEPLNVDARELMERFVRGDSSRNSEGSGLGLNIAQSLMEVQHGKLELTVDGDLFKVTLRFPAELGNN